MTVTATVVTVCVSVCVALLAASLIVLSLVQLEAGPSERFSLSSESRRATALAAVSIMRVTIWASGLGTLVGLGALVWPRCGPRWAAVSLAVVAVGAFMWMAIATVRAVVEIERRS